LKELDHHLTLMYHLVVDLIICLGNEFAHTYMVVFLHYLVIHYKWSIIYPDEKIVVDPFLVFEKGLQLKVHKKEHMEFD